jgi:pimeloyl-ACP methyl ester carboxylesterase
MPSQNVNITANFHSIIFTPNLEFIMGVDTLKKVYSIIPPSHKGVVFLFHGTNSSAAGWTLFNENIQLIKTLIADTFAVIITEAEEVTYNIDLNGDGAQQWSINPSDPDFGNIAAIRDTFINRGSISASDQFHALGMSNGGTFATHCAAQLGFESIVAYCSLGMPSLMTTITIPIIWCMAQHDGNPNVGPAGNATALLYHDSLEQRGVCTDYHLKYAEPLYPERFKRINGVSASLSTQLFNELLANGWLDGDNKLINYPDYIVTQINANISSYPVYNSLGNLQKVEYANELNATFAEHQIYNDFNAKIIAFLNDPCTNSTVGVSENTMSNSAISLSVFPNPAQDVISFSEPQKILGIYSMDGALIRNMNEESGTISIETLQSGVYFIKTEKGVARFVKIE